MLRGNNREFVSFAHINNDSWFPANNRAAFYLESIAQEFMFAPVRAVALANELACEAEKWWLLEDRETRPPNDYQDSTVLTGNASSPSVVGAKYRSWACFRRSASLRRFHTHNETTTETAQTKAVMKKVYLLFASTTAHASQTNPRVTHTRNTRNTRHTKRTSGGEDAPIAVRVVAVAGLVAG
jgi:hypothetical protein